jgi:RNA polymerase sigma-70 factor (ECF subfamily)
MEVGDVDGVRAGDPAAFRRVYAVLSPLVLGYLRAHGSADPEALTQEVFLTIFRRAADLRGGPDGLRTFALSVAHARLVDEWRARARRPDIVEFDETEDPRVAPPAEVEALAALDSEAVGALPEAQRSVVALRTVAGLSLEETADVLGRSVGAIKQLQRRGLLGLRALAEERGVTP